MANELLVSESFKDRAVKATRDAIGNIIPDEEYEKMVVAEVKAFFEEENTAFKVEDAKNDYGHTTHQEYGVACTPFRLLVWKECHRVLMAKLRETFNSDEFKAELAHHWDGEGFHTVTGDLADRWERILQEKSINLVADMFRGMFTDITQKAKQDMLDVVSSSNGY